MKIFLVALATLMSMTAFANTGWEEASRTTYETETKSEIEELLVLYPSVKADILEAEMDVNSLSYIEVIDARYKFMGETVCEANDPRLSKSIVTFTVCEEPQNEGEINCLSNLILVSDRDPCADGSL
jgi:hypothetical protein